MLTYCTDKNTSKFSIELSLKEKVLGCHNHDEKILEFTYNIIIFPNKETTNIKFCDN